MSAPASLFDIEVPAPLIAQRPLEQRDSSRLLLLPRASEGWSHRRFNELPALLSTDALLVLNNTRVFPARLEGTRSSGAPLEVLLTEELAPGRWRTLSKGARRIRAGERIAFAAGEIPATAARRDEGGQWELEFDDPSTLRERIWTHGEAPLPPYVRRPNGKGTGAQDAGAAHREWYQTCYARVEGSIAAPTAGFHFTPAVFDALKARGIAWTELTLHVGIGTFSPIQDRDLARHQMHREWFAMPSESCRAILSARSEGRPVVAVGTTTARALESWAREGQPEGFDGYTELFIRAPYAFRAVDGLITNFHQPASTLLQMVAAFHGEARILAAYQEAIAREYRFFSYGDCMAILPPHAVSPALR